MSALIHTGASFTSPSFAGASYLDLVPIGNVTGNFYIELHFRSFNNDGLLLYASENADGTGQFVSLAVSNSLVQFR